MDKKNLADMLFDQMDKLIKCETEEEIQKEVTRSEAISKIAENIIDFGNMQLKAFDAIGDIALKKDIKRISSNG